MTLAEFETIKRPKPGDSPLYPSKVTRCKSCGWETIATNHSIYGPPNALEMALLSHRVAHLEGRIVRPVDG
jgi:hypothetical protein